MSYHINHIFFKSISIIALLVLPLVCFGQFGSRYNIGTSPIHANPAYAGVLSNGALNTNLTIANPDHFFLNANYHMHLPRSNSGIGMVAGYKRFEFYSISSGGLAYSYQTKISDKLTLSSGISSIYTADRDDFFPEFDTSYFSFDGGVLLYSNRFFSSLSTYELRRQDETLNFTLSLGYNFSIKKLEGLSVTPILNITLQDGEGIINSRLTANYKNIKFTIGGGNKELLTGIGYQYKSWGLHYILSYIKTPATKWFYVHNRFSLQLKVPKSIARKTDSFNFDLF